MAREIGGPVCPYVIDNPADGPYGPEAIGRQPGCLAILTLDAASILSLAITNTTSALAEVVDQSGPTSAR